MIRCALAEIRRLATLTPAFSSPSISLSSTRGSTTTPLPITQVFSECRIPEGIRWNLNSSPSRTIVCPALLPPWKRTIIAARSREQVDDLPLALIAPLGADYDHAWHQRLILTVRAGERRVG